MSTDIDKLSQASKMIAMVRTPEDIPMAADLAAQAEAMRLYAKKSGMGLEAQNHAARVRIGFERAGGRVLLAMVKAKGAQGNPGGQGAAIVRSHDATAQTPTLTAMGLTRDQSSRWQKQAAVPDDEFESWCAESSEAHREVTTAELLRLAKKNEAPSCDTGPCDEGGTVEDLDELIASGKRFGTLYMDPPWVYGNQATRAATGNHYEGLSVDELCSAEYAGRFQALAADDAHMHLWTTNAFLPDSFRVMASVGFEYKSVFVWAKPQMGIGNYWRVSHEFLLFGKRGNAKFADHSMMSWATFDRGKHSSKPHAVRHMIEKASPGPRIEFFGREKAPGWWVWGNQIPWDLFGMAGS